MPDFRVNQIKEEKSVENENNNINTEPTEQNAKSGQTVQKAQTDSELESLKQSNSEYEKALKGIFGVSDDEELGDLSQRINAYNRDLQKKLSAADNRIIAAEIKSLSGYDTKLLAKVIDYSNIKVGEDGTVTGLDEAVKAAKEEFPAVILRQKSEPYAPFHPADGVTETAHKTMNDILRNRRSY